MRRWKRVRRQDEGTEDEVLVARRALSQVRDQVFLLASGADQQNAFLHPCGWTRDEPFVHIAEHEPCAPMGELYENFEWPFWQRLLSPVLDDEMKAALNSLSSVLEDFFSVPYEDEIATLDSEPWAQVRAIAKVTLAVLDARGSVGSD